MPKLWLTYAWKDNEDSQIDYVISELQAAGIDVGFDRAQLLAGRRLWDQIDKAIADPDLDGWAIYVTQASLESEPCQEELPYALDRSLRVRGSSFALIGIFPGPIDRSLIPSALATRLYVNLQSANWKVQVVSGLSGSKPTVNLEGALPFGFEWHPFSGKHVLEVWPRAGSWTPFIVSVKNAERSRLSLALPGPRGFVTGTGMHSFAETKNEYGTLSGIQLNHAITSENTAHVFFTEYPTEIYFGNGIQMYKITS